MLLVNLPVKRTKEYVCKSTGEKQKDRAGVKHLHHLLQPKTNYVNKT